MSKRARAHVDEYKLGEDGSYAYTGTYWRWEHPERRQAFLRMAWILLGAAAVAVLGAGFIPAPGTVGAFYILVPYVGAIIACALAASSLLSLTREGEKLRNHVYQRSAATLVPKLLVGLVASAACAAGTIVHALLTQQFGAGAAGFAALMFVAALALGHLASRARELSFSQEQ